jgi:hypothetical protein
MTAAASSAQETMASPDRAPVSRVSPARLTVSGPKPAELSAAGLSPAMLSPARLGQLARRTAEDDGWRQLVRFTGERRWFQRVALTDDYEIWLLSWLPGQHTGFHDHGDACGAFVVAQGELRETLAAVGSRRVRHRPAGLGTVTTFGGRHLHEVGNGVTSPSVSVHAYSPPLTAMRRYEMTGSGLKLAGTDRAELDW